ncbi:hypothetical protein JJL45_08235 [Tamlana sp. s12]|uniref:hypothetical protein n=1 Tax=Tamlana sp. s12 TaxID=1630406 RepID=UPI0008002182|nr:hypothetical protein [Tamlana sp. s12]OBQ55392.1 hypothetical protein VQ01_07915 [Tamlana sp. s12]QQY80929.1 hypothetical protein JJL45_08235 [Tamlana sp. s12]
MKLFLKHIFIFGIVFFIAEKTLCYFVQNAPTKENDRRLEYVLESQMNKDIIILGSSRGAHDIIASKIEENTGLETYNLSYRGSDIDFHEFVLRSLLKHNKAPKIVLLVIDPVYEFIQEPSLGFRTDHIIPLKKYDDINNELIKREKFTFLSKILCVARLNKKDFSFKKKEASPFEVLSSHGSQILDEKRELTIVYNNENVEYSQGIEQNKKLIKFNNIKALCKNKDIELTFIIPPNFSRFNRSFYNRFKELVDEDNKVMIYDTLNVNYTQPHYFFDESHLNKEGAEIFTSEISLFINENK